MSELTTIIKTTKKALGYRDALAFMGQACSTALDPTFALPTLTPAQMTEASGRAKTIIETPITGLISFAEGEPDPG